MRRALAVLLAAVACGPPAHAREGQQAGAGEHGDRPMPGYGGRPGASPTAGERRRNYAEGEQGKPQENSGVMSMDDNEPFFQFIGDRMEYRTDGSRAGYLWDIDSWYGTDYDKLFIEAEGQISTEGRTEPANLEVYWNRALAPYWDTQLGLKQDFKPGDNRTSLASGVQGLAPYIFRMDATAYVSEDGDVSAKVEVERSFLLTQRLWVIPRFETNLAIQEVREYNTGSGINSVELELRMSYQIARKFAPYVGVSWRRDVGETASLKRADGEDTNAASFVTGVRLWF